MKKVISLLIIICSVILSTVNVEALNKYTPQSSPLKIHSWNDFKNVPLFLMRFGLYDNGRMVNEFMPDNQGFKEGGMLTDSYGGLKWWKYVSGSNNMDIKFNARVDGLTMHTSSPKEDILWIKILGVWNEGNVFYLYTVDNRNTYRIWLIDYDTFKRKKNK